MLSFLGSHKQRDDVGYDLSVHYAACAAHTLEMSEGVEPLAESAHTDDAEVVVVAFGTPARYVQAAVRALRADGCTVGYVRPITLFPFPTEAVAAAARGARAVAVYENNQGQMIDDVRLAVLGHARRSTSSVASASTTRVSGSPPTSTCGSSGNGSSR